MIDILETSNHNEEYIIRNKFTLISFICSILVIYIHAYNLETYGIHNRSEGLSKIVYIIEACWSNVLNIAVPMFFFVSGILFFRTFEISRLIDKWKKRVVTIVIPYIIWCSLYYLYYVICTNIPQIASLMNASVVKLSFYEWFSWLWVKQYYTLWFLQNLIIFIIATPIIYLLLKNYSPKCHTGLIFLIIILLCIHFFPIQSPYASGFDIYLIGSYIGINCRDGLKYRNKIISIISCIYILFSLGTAFRFWNVVTKILFFIAVWFVFDLFSIENGKFPWWMSITFFTYVAHDILLETIEKAVWKGFGNHTIYALLDYIFVPLITEVLLIGIAYVMRKRFSTLWSIITGDRG